MENLRRFYEFVSIISLVILLASSITLITNFNEAFAVTDEDLNTNNGNNKEEINSSSNSNSTSTDPLDVVVNSTSTDLLDVVEIQQFNDSVSVISSSSTSTDLLDDDGNSTSTVPLDVKKEKIKKEKIKDYEDYEDLEFEGIVTGIVSNTSFDLLLKDDTIVTILADDTSGLTLGDEVEVKAEGVDGDLYFIFDKDNKNFVPIFDEFNELITEFKKSDNNEKSIVKGLSNNPKIIKYGAITAAVKPLYTTVDDPAIHIVDPSRTLDGVGKLLLMRDDGIFVCTGSLLLTGEHILTAAHCVTNNRGIINLSAGTITFFHNSGVEEIRLDVSKISIPKKWDGNFIRGNDIAVIKLENVASEGITRYDIDKNKHDDIGVIGEKAGFGMSGTGDTGATFFDEQKRAGENKYDDVADVWLEKVGLKQGKDFEEGSVLMYDFDNGLTENDAFGFFFGNSDLGLGNKEVMASFGDSGGPTLVDGKITGVASYILSFTIGSETSDVNEILDSSFGELSGDTRVSKYAHFIYDAMNGWFFAHEISYAWEELDELPNNTELDTEETDNISTKSNSEEKVELEGTIVGVTTFDDPNTSGSFTLDGQTIFFDIDTEFDGLVAGDLADDLGVKVEAISQDDDLLATEIKLKNYEVTEEKESEEDSKASITFTFETDESDYVIVGDALVAVDEEMNEFLELDGDGDYLMMTNDTSTNYLTEFSIVAWIQPEYSNGSSEFTIVSKENSFVLSLNNRIEPQKIVKFSIFDGIKWTMVESSSTINEEWTNVAATFSGESIMIYVNGELEGTQQVTGLPIIAVNGKLKTVPVDGISSDSDIVLGAYLDTNRGETKIQNQFSGSIDDVSLFDYVLEDQQILGMYEQTKDAYVIVESVKTLDEIIAEMENEN